MNKTVRCEINVNDMICPNGMLNGMESVGILLGNMYRYLMNNK